MPRRIAETKRTRILQAGQGVTDDLLAGELGLSLATVREYRTRPQQEILIADFGPEAEPPWAPVTPVAALTEALQIATKKMRTDETQASIREARECALAVLKSTGLEPERDPLGGLGDKELLEELKERLGFREVEEPATRAGRRVIETTVGGR